ncbi:MAG: shikimate dehydrogenase [Cellulophaga sp.]
MENKEDKQRKYGLVGKNISYSFSKTYFTEKFLDNNLDQCSYQNFDLQDIQEFQNLAKNTKDLKGVNITTPYKESVIPFLDTLEKNAAKIGAINTVKFTSNGLIGYNTDVYGFQKSIEPFLNKHHTKALILGTGGASKAVAFVFNELKIDFKYVSRTPKKDGLMYDDLNKTILSEYAIIVNCTPLGTFPNIENKPTIPYEHIETQHLLFDLIYNPEKTAFLKEGENRGATIVNGLRMLQLQAEKAWEIWNSDSN